MNSRPTFPLLASLAAAAALACSACGGARQLQAADPAALVSAPANLLSTESAGAETERRAFTPFVVPGAGLELADELIDEKDEKRRYKIGFTFPQLRGQLDRPSVKFNRAVRALAEREVRDFKRIMIDPEGRPWTDDEFWQDAYDSLGGHYEIIHLSDDLASVRFDLDTYGRGAAHAVQSYLVLNFDLKSGRVIELRDLFAPGTAHLRAVASYCAAELRRQDAEERAREAERLKRLGKPNPGADITADQFIDSGAAAEAANYRAWNLTAEGVLVSFAACQVDGCSAGKKEVLVPFSALDAVLNQSGPAARLFTRQPR